MALKNNIPKILEEKNINMYVLAKKTGLAYSTVFRICKKQEDLSCIKLEVAVKIASGLEVKLEEIFNFEE